MGIYKNFIQTEGKIMVALKLITEELILEIDNLTQ